MEKKKDVCIWMPLIGFDKEKDDKGAMEYLENAGFIPEAMSIFLFHPDIVNQHEDMKQEFVLHPDNCSYYGAPRNSVRDRQDWTNYELRSLVNNLETAGVDTYLGVMGVYLEDSRHKEWESDHLELLSYGAETGLLNLNVLKRFKDGTYYEDFFIEKLTKALTDYGFTGFHAADFFCPPEHSISEGDFSTDMLEQFREHSHITYPEHIEARLGHDEPEDLNARQTVIWGEMRQAWIDFNVERWYRFWKKVCDAVHAIGKKVMINNAWASDPVEARYRYGIDYKRIYEAGIDYLISETVPDHDLADSTGNRFNQYMTMAQLIGAYTDPAKQYCLLGVGDTTEEWEHLHHSAPRVDRNAFGIGVNYVYTDKVERSNAGVMITLGDCLSADDWNQIKQKMSLSHDKTPEAVEGVTVLWSDHFVEEFLSDYIESRRPSVHQIMSRFKDNGVFLGAVARAESLKTLTGAILVPCFDLLSEEEKSLVMNYKKGPVFCMAPSSYKPDAAPDFYLEDKNAFSKQAIFAYNLPCVDQEKIDSFFEKTPETVEDCEFSDFCFFLVAMPCAEMSKAFMEACKYLLNNLGASLFTSDAQISVEKRAEHVYRIYVFNRKIGYASPKVICKKNIKSVNLIGDYPISPPQMIMSSTFDEGNRLKDGAKYEMLHRYDPLPGEPDGFVAKVKPSGATVYEVTVE